MKPLNLSWARPLSVAKFWRIVRMTKDNPQTFLRIGKYYPSEVTLIIDHAGFKYVLIQEFVLSLETRFGRTVKNKEYAVRLHPNYN